MASNITLTEFEALQQQNIQEGLNRDFRNSLMIAAAKEADETGSTTKLIAQLS
ncbi:MAG: hypothetical protein V4691_04070 [Pseudomonadota bacterium]